MVEEVGHRLVLGHPEGIVQKLGQVNQGVDIVLVEIDARLIATGLDSLTEGLGAGRDGLAVHLVGPGRGRFDPLPVVVDRQVQGLAVQQSQDVSRLFPGLLFVHRLGKKVNAGLQSRRFRAGEIGPELLVLAAHPVGVAPVPDLNDGKADAVPGHGLPVDDALVGRHVDAGNSIPALVLIGHAAILRGEALETVDAPGDVPAVILDAGVPRLPLRPQRADRREQHDAGDQQQQNRQDRGQDNARLFFSLSCHGSLLDTAPVRGSFGCHYTTDFAPRQPPSFFRGNMVIVTKFFLKDLHNFSL